MQRLSETYSSELLVARPCIASVTEGLLTWDVDSVWAWDVDLQNNFVLDIRVRVAMRWRSRMLLVTK